MKPPHFTSLAYRAVWNSCQTSFSLLYRTEVTGIAHVPASGPFILAANHASHLDPPLIGSYLPRELYYFAKKTLLQGPLSPVLRAVNTIPIDRDADSDLGAFRRVFEVLKRGGAILIFPEGTRSHNGLLGEARNGVGLIACRSQVPILPTRVFGSFDVWSRNRPYPTLNKNLGLSFGPVLLPEVYDPGKDETNRYQIASTTIMKAIEALSPPRLESV